MARGITGGTIKKTRGLIEWILAAGIVVTLLSMGYWALVGLGVIVP